MRKIDAAVEKSIEFNPPENIDALDVDTATVDTTPVLPKKPPIFLSVLYYAAAPVITIFMFTVFLIYLNIYPYGDLVMSSYDMLAQIAPFGEHLFDVFDGASSLFYSFSIAGGADTFGTLAYCFISPFSFLFLVGGKGMVNYMVPFVMGGKIVAIALSASFYIRKSFPKIHPIAGAVIAVLYTYSGYFHVASTYINWLDFLIFLPLVVYTFRRFIKTDKYILFSLSVSAMIYTCFSIACFSLLIIYLIIFAYVYLCVEKTQRREKITKICLSLALAVGLSLPVILPAFMAYLHSGRNTGLFENLDNDLDVIHLYRKTSYVLSDVVLFVLAVYYFSICRLKDNYNKFLLVATALIFAPVLVDEICNLLNAGSYMSYSLRFGFLNSMLALQLACLAIENVKKHERVKAYKWPISIIIGIILLAACALTVYVCHDIIDNGKESFVFKWAIAKEGTPLYKAYESSDFADGFSSKFAHSLGGMEIIMVIFLVFGLAAATVILCTRLKLMPVRVAAVILIAISLIQAGFDCYHMTLGNRNTMITYDQVQLLLDEIDTRENGDFTKYRIKDYDDRMTADAPLTQHYRSYTVFSSVIDAKNFVPTSYFRYGGNGINSMKSKGGNIFSDCLFGYKYALSQQSYLTPQIWKKVYTKDPFYLYENTAVFPTAFKIPGGEYSITEGTYDEQLNGFYRWLGGSGDLCATKHPSKITYVESGDYYSIKLSSEKNCAGNVFIVADLPDGVSLRYSTGSAYDEEDNKPLDDNFFVNKSYTKSSSEYNLSVKAVSGEINEDILRDSFKISTISLTKVLELSKTAWDNAVDITFDASSFTVNAKADENCYLFVNYIAIDGFKCNVNGSSAEIIDNPLGFLCTPIKSGENSVEMKYSSPYVKYIIIGIFASIAVLALILAMHQYYGRIKVYTERIVDWCADILAAVIFGFGFCYPFVLFLIKLFKLIFKL